MTAAYRLSTDERWDLLTRPMALLSRDAKHNITPYIEEPPSGTVDLSKAAPANLWRFAADKETYQLYRAVWQMGSPAPASLLALKEKMIRAMDKSPEIQQEAIANYDHEIPRVLRDLRNDKSPLAQKALAELGGNAVNP